MNFKKLIVAGALLIAPQSMTNTTINFTKEDIHEILDKQAKKEREPVYYQFEISQELLKQIDAMCLDTNCPVVFKRSLEDLRNTPLFMHGSRRHIGEYLGYDQYDYILKHYNNDTIPDSSKTADDLRINNFSHINFPLIYDEIGAAVPHTLDSLMQDERFADYRDAVQPDDTLIVEMPQANGRYTLLYYETGKLILGTYATLGRGRSTPKGMFQVDYKVEYKRSRKYGNVPMPYALHVTKNIFIHQGKVAHYTNSHGCNRIPGLYAEALYYLTMAPKMDMLNNSYLHRLDSAKQEIFDSLRRGAPQVLIVE